MVTDILQRGIVVKRRVYEPVIPLLKKVMQQQNTNQIIDLCSGASGPWVQLLPKFEEEQWPLSVTLTDKYPNIEAFQNLAETNNQVSYRMEPVDATDVNPNLKGVRTVFTAFHHFRPDFAKKILQNAVDEQAAICVFEFTERRWKSVLMTPIIAPLAVFLTTPFFRPITFSRIVWTYLIPVIPFVTAWDGVVSNLRTYTQQDLEEIVNAISSNGYTWEVGQIVSSETGIPITYVLGYPENTECCQAESAIRVKQESAIT